MIVELQRFIEFKEGGEWWDDKSPHYHARGGCEFCPMLVNTEYVVWACRRFLSEEVEMCDVHFADRGQTFIIDITYEEMRKLLKPDATSHAA